MPKFTKLFETGRIGKLEVKNRIVYPSIVTGLLTKEGDVTDSFIDYYAERAIGGAGLICTEACYTRPGYPCRINLNDDKCIPGLKRLVWTVHEGGARIVCEVNPHKGRADSSDPASPSDVPHPFSGVVPRVLSIADIRKFEEEFGQAARRVKEIGFDGIMIHGANGYLVSEFLSPITNRRTDEYGGDLKGRAKFALELMEVTREEVGSDYPVIFRLMADDKLEGGFGVKDAAALCRILQEEGVDAIAVTAGFTETPEWAAPYMYLPPGCNANLSQAIKREVKIPVSVAGRINDPYIAEEILREGKADFVDLGRALVADPWLPMKAMQGRISDIRKCTACLTCSEVASKAGAATHTTPLTCAVNPAVGREREFESLLKPAREKKRVLVIGGGPGGMEAAIIAAQREHEVTLWEASDRLGGQLNLAAIPSGKGDLNSLLDYLKTQVDKLNVVVQLWKKATPTAVDEFAPDAVVVAVGSIPFIPDIPGIDGENVIDGRQVLSGEKETGNRVVIIGGGSIGCETGDFLAEKGKEVVVAFPEPEPPIFLSIRRLLLERLGEKRVKILAGVKQFKEITPEGIRLIDREGNEVFLEADNIVLAAGATPDRTLAQSLKGRVPELYEVGDCVEARRLLEAVHEGAEAALQI